MLLLHRCAGQGFVERIREFLASALLLASLVPDGHSGSSSTSSQRHLLAGGPQQINRGAVHDSRLRGLHDRLRHLHQRRLDGDQPVDDRIELPLLVD